MGKKYQYNVGDTYSFQIDDEDYSVEYFRHGEPVPAEHCNNIHYAMAVYIHEEAMEPLEEKPQLVIPDKILEATVSHHSSVTPTVMKGTSDLPLLDLTPTPQKERKIPLEEYRNHLIGTFEYGWGQGGVQVTFDFEASRTQFTSPNHAAIELLGYLATGQAAAAMSALDYILKCPDDDAFDILATRFGGQTG